jgi:YD repeat-containing protein
LALGGCDADRSGALTDSRVTSIVYNDSTHVVTKKSSLKTNGDTLLQREDSYDDLGRIYKTRKTDADGSLAITSNSYELASGGYTYRLTSNPWRTASDSTMGWTRRKIDQNGRVVEVASFTGSAKPAPWAEGGNTTSTGASTTEYASYNTTVTDQAGKQRVNMTDGLGRLHSVTETTSPGMQVITYYAYDALDDLTTVNQGAQNRTFVYDSLKRLKNATNPENGTTSWVYDANGNVTSREQPGSVTTTWEYDRLNRMTSKTMPEGTASYTWNTPDSHPSTNGIGSLASSSFGAFTTSYGSYDLLGRVTAQSQTVSGSQPYAFSYAYNAAGGLMTEHYPSGHIVGYCRDGAGQVTAVIPAAVDPSASCPTGNSNYADTVAYAPQGTVSSLKLGSGLWGKLNSMRGCR